MSKLPLYNLICKKHLSMGVTCLTSIYKQCKDELDFVILEDGTLNDDDIDVLHRSLKNVRIIRSSAADKLLERHLVNYPFCAKYRKLNPLIRKVVDVPLIAAGSFSFCDSDILFKQPFSGIDLRNSNAVDFVYMTDAIESYSVSFYDRYFNRTRIRLMDRVNSGFMFVREGVWSLDFVEQFLSEPRYHLHPTLIEQTCWAALAARTRSAAWNSSQITVAGTIAADAPGAIAVHYITPTRHLFDESSAARTVNDLPAQSLKLCAATSTSAFVSGLQRVHRRIVG
jgi:hypothetical protein